jgi:hypothetical protein
MTSGPNRSLINCANRGVVDHPYDLFEEHSRRNMATLPAIAQSLHRSRCSTPTTGATAAPPRKPKNPRRVSPMCQTPSNAGD